MNKMDEAIKNGTGIFVFGSNLAGVHGAGAAAHAETHWGAKRGVGVGISGLSYALPTKDEKIRTLPRSVIKRYVDLFLAFAKNHPELTFKVTQVGCGLAGYDAQDIAPMFRGAPSNCWFDAAWMPFLCNANYWGHV